MSDKKRIRHARPEELAQIMEIYASARSFMAANGNAEQWSDGYPQKELIQKDIEKFENEFKNNIQKVRDFEKIASSKSLDDYQRNHLDVVKCVNRIVSGKEVRNDYRKNTNA